MKRLISSFTKSPKTSNVDSKGDAVVGPRAKNSYRAARRNAGKVMKRASEKKPAS